MFGPGTATSRRRGGVGSGTSPPRLVAAYSCNQCKAALEWGGREGVVSESGEGFANAGRGGEHGAAGGCFEQSLSSSRASPQARPGSDGRDGPDCGGAGQFACGLPRHTPLTGPPHWAPSLAQLTVAAVASAGAGGAAGARAASRRPRRSSHGGASAEEEEVLEAVAGAGAGKNRPPARPLLPVGRPSERLTRGGPGSGWAQGLLKLRSPEPKPAVPALRGPGEPVPPMELDPPEPQPEDAATLAAAVLCPPILLLCARSLSAPF